MATEAKRKEFWEMTRAGVSASLDIPDDAVVRSVLASHEKAVRQAVAEGKAVPEAVLRDYPDVAKIVAKPIDKQPQSGIMTSGGQDDTESSGVPATERIRPRIESPDVSQREQARTAQADVEGGSEQALSGEGPGSGQVRSVADRRRDVGGGGVESGNPPRDTGVGERLTAEPLAPGSLPTSEPKDIILDSSSDIGANAGAASRFDANLDAIRTLKFIESENRKATPAEQSVIAKYSGFGDGAFNGAFDKYDRGDIWGRRGKALKEITTEDEFQAIERSRLNAFYTTPEVINATWQALRQIGVDNLSHPRVLEPSAGSGRFLGFQPKEMATKSQRTAVELDQLTGRLLKQLYPNTEVYVMGFEKAPLPKDYYDIAISNVPFGDYPINDPSFKRERRKLTRSIHNYFFAKSLEQLRPGGVLAFVTSHSTLDAPTAKPVREALAEQADLIGAIRLPKTAFPDTEVVTDVVFMKKRLPTDTPGDKSWVNTFALAMKSEKDKWGHSRPVTANINQYFVDHPEMVLGRHSAGGSMYGGDEYTVELEPGTSLTAEMSKAVKQIPANIVTDMPRVERPRVISLASALNVHEGARVVGDDGGIYIKRQGSLVNANLSAVEEAKVKQMLAIRDAARNVVNLQLRDAKDAEIIEAQQSLNTLYDNYVTSNGTLTSPQNSELLKRDPDEPFLKSLEQNAVLRKAREDRTAEEKRLVSLLTGQAKPSAQELKAVKMPVFSQRVIHGMAPKTSVNTDTDAETVVRNEVGTLDFKRMGALLGKSEDEIIATLAAKRVIYKNPVGGWEPADQYLTGDVREKLRVAEAALTARPEYGANVEALKSVQPEYIQPGQIAVRLGAPWIPASDVNEFVKQLVDAGVGWYTRGGTNYFRYNRATGKWQDEDRIDGNSAKMTSEYGTIRMPASEIIDRLLNGKLVEVMDSETDEEGKERSVRNPKETIAAQEKAQAIEQAFKQWLWSDSDRARRLADEYNNRFNNYRARAFDGGHMELPGMAEKWTRQLHKHQKDAIWRVVQDRTALLAHEVGFGKTAVMVAGGMELRRLGLVQKNLYVVPKATHAQFASQFADVYPFAKVLFPGEGDFTPETRAEFVSRSVTGDWDAIILSDSQFRKIPVRPETEVELLHEEIASFREALEMEEESQDDDGGSRYGRRRKKESRTHKELQKAIARMEERIAEKQAKIGDVTDKTTYFEDIGIDQIFVDEADMFKNLKFATSMGRIKGLPNSDSDRAFDMYSKVRHLQKNKGRGIVFATGTPVANTIAEMYTQMRYLQPDMLEAKEIKHFDAWAKTFGETTETLEQTPTGAYKLTQRFARFANAPELSGMWQQVADIRVADEVPELVRQRPRLVDEQGRNRRTIISTPPDEALLGYMKLLAKRADELRGKDPKEDNMLKIANDARLASLDMRMVDPYAPVNPNGKVVVASKKIADIYRETTKDKGTQLIFLDIGTPKAKEKADETETIADTEELETVEEAKVLRNVYGNIKSQLIAEGVPENEIAFIHDAKNDKQKIRLMERVNEGGVRVLIGSTGKLGTGVNVQKRAAALHHLDCPWRPRDIEQREGRVIRQGNIVYGPKRDANGQVIDPGPGVKVYTYVTERSFDAYMWQAVEAKSKAIKAIMRRAVPPRAIDDIDSLSMSAGEAKAVASGNPDVLKSVTLKNTINRLQLLRASHTDANLRAKEQLQSLPKLIAQSRDTVGKIEKDAALVAKGGKDFGIKVKGVAFTERTPASESLKTAVESAPVATDAGSAVDVGEYKGFAVKAFNTGPTGGYKLLLVNPATNYTHATTAIPYSELTPGGALQRLENKASNVPATLETTKRELVNHESNLKSYQAKVEAPFEHEERLVKMEAELSRLERKLQGEKVAEEAITEDIDGEDIDDGKIPGYRFGAKEEPQPMPPATPTEIVKAEQKAMESASDKPITWERETVAEVPKVETPLIVQEKRDISKMGVDEFNKAVNEAVDWQYLTVKSGKMATKTDLDEWLMKRYSIDASAARTISNSTDDRRYFTTGRNTYTGKPEVAWEKFNANRAEPQQKDYPELAKTAPRVRIKEISERLKQINESRQTTKKGRPSKNTLAIREKLQTEFDNLSKEADKLTQQILHPEIAIPKAAAGMSEVGISEVAKVSPIPEKPKEHNAEPADYGRIAREQGIIKAAAQDKAFLKDYIKGTEVGDPEGDKALKEWNEGYQEAHKEITDREVAKREALEGVKVAPVKHTFKELLRIYNEPSGSAGISEKAKPITDRGNMPRIRTRLNRRTPRITPRVGRLRK